MPESFPGLTKGDAVFLTVCGILVGNAIIVHKFTTRRKHGRHV